MAIFTIFLVMPQTYFYIYILKEIEHFITTETVPVGILTRFPIFSSAGAIMSPDTWTQALAESSTTFSGNTSFSSSMLDSPLSKHLRSDSTFSTGIPSGLTLSGMERRSENPTPCSTGVQSLTRLKISILDFRIDRIRIWIRIVG